MRSPVRWGILGAGRIATHVMAGAIQAAAGAELYAVAARDPARAHALGAPHVYSSYDELLADPDVDVAYISLPNDVHARWTRHALSGGKHVLCEKPLALTADEVDDVAAAAQRANRTVVEAMMFRWHPRMHALHDALRSIGDVRRVETGFCFAGVGAGDYRLDAGRGGGALYDVGCYGVHAALQVFGWQRPVDVSATALMGATGVDLTVDITVQFESGVAHLHASMDEPPAQWLRIEGAGGALDLTSPVFTAWWANDTEIVFKDGGGMKFPAVDPYRLMIEAISARIADGNAWVLPVEQSRAVAAVIDRARLALPSVSRPS